MLRLPCIRSRRSSSIWCAKASNDALHQGARSRYLAEHCIEFALILEDALMHSDDSLATVGDDEEVAEATDRAYWERRGTKRSMAVLDELLDHVKQVDPSLEPKYNKFYVGLAHNGMPDNFVLSRVKKDWVRMEVRLPRSDSLTEMVDGSGLDVMYHDDRNRRYRIRVAPRRRDQARRTVRPPPRRIRRHRTRVAPGPPPADCGIQPG